MTTRRHLLAALLVAAVIPAAASRPAAAADPALAALEQRSKAFYELLARGERE